MEVISFGSRNDKPPLLFVHGSYCGAWIWAPYFLPAFEQAGWWGAAISLRGHGKSEGLERLDSFGVDAYLEDIAQGVGLFDRLPVLIGHSLGGYLIQKFALDYPVRGLVLLSSPSLLGLQGSGRHIATHSPALALQLASLMAWGPSCADTKAIASALFQDRDMAKRMIPLLPPLQRESSRVAFEASWPDFRKPKFPVPTLALGGDADAFVPEFECRYEGQFWEGESKILRNVPHGLMLDSCWPDVLREIFGWLSAQFKPKNP
ncbi:MAG: alpha/beta hydrolase [Alphaproteobacteria bacterium]|nr:alpha/beta hydrolase [Alphaproteobacteria bacterium]